MSETIAALASSAVGISLACYWSDVEGFEWVGVVFGHVVRVFGVS